MNRATRRANGMRPTNGSVRLSPCCDPKACPEHAQYQAVSLDTRKHGRWVHLGVLDKDRNWVIVKGGPAEPPERPQPVTIDFGRVNQHEFDDEEAAS